MTDDEVLGAWDVSLAHGMPAGLLAAGLRPEEAAALAAAIAARPAAAIA